MAVEDLHVGVGLAGVIDVMRAIAATTPIQTPSVIDCTDAQFSAPGPTIRLSLRYALASVLRYFSSALEVSN